MKHRKPSGILLRDNTVWPIGAMVQFMKDSLYNRICNCPELIRPLIYPHQKALPLISPSGGCQCRSCLYQQCAVFPPIPRAHQQMIMNPISMITNAISTFISCPMRHGTLGETDRWVLGGGPHPRESVLIV